MNILIPHSWLKEYLEVQLDPKKIAEYLSLCGTSVEKINKVDNDFIYDIEVTTNRVDMMSILGIAREAAAILPQFGIKAKLKKDPPAKLGTRKVLNSQNIDGIKLNLSEDDWVLLRPSGTEPLIRCYAEAGSQKEVRILMKNSLDLLS